MTDDLKARGVRVKALTWRRDDGGDLRSGPYEIEALSSFWVNFGGEPLFTGHATEEDAVAFANQHHKAYILAALEISDE